MAVKSISKYEQALEVFVNQYKKKPRVLAIFVTGSYVHSNLDKNSDLDVYVLTDKGKTRERGNLWINGVEVEYFINPVDQVRHYFKTEIGSKGSSAAHMFVSSRILYQKDATVNQLIKEAGRALKKKSPPMKKIDVEIARYSIDDTWKDLEDVYLRRDPFAFAQVADDLLRDCQDLFFKVHRVHKEKPKRLREYLRGIDKEYEKRYSNALVERDVDKQFKDLTKLVKYVEKLLGGKRPKEWILKSKCTV